MQGVLTGRRLAALAAAAALVAAGVATTADYVAPVPGAGLEPVDQAESLISILQGSRSILWTTLSGPVVSYRAEGWPVEIDGNQLGGGVVLERPESPTAGTVSFGERPRRLTFEIGG